MIKNWKSYYCIKVGDIRKEGINIEGTGRYWN